MLWFLHSELLVCRCSGGSTAENPLSPGIKCSQAGGENEVVMPGGKQAGSSNIHIKPLALGDINNKWRVSYRFSTKQHCFSCDLVSSSVCLALEFQASPARIISSMQCFCCAHQAVLQPNKREFSSESWLWKTFQGVLIQETARWSWVIFSDTNGIIRWYWVTIAIGAQVGTESGGWVSPSVTAESSWKEFPLVSLHPHCPTAVQATVSPHLTTALTSDLLFCFHCLPAPF